MRCGQRRRAAGPRAEHAAAPAPPPRRRWRGPSDASPAPRGLRARRRGSRARGGSGCPGRRRSPRTARAARRCSEPSAPSRNIFTPPDPDPLAARSRCAAPPRCAPSSWSSWTCWSTRRRSSPRCAEQLEVAQAVGLHGVDPVTPQPVRFPLRVQERAQHLGGAGGAGRAARRSFCASSSSSPVGSPVRASRTISPPGGSGVSRVMPQRRSASPFSQAPWMSWLSQDHGAVRDARGRGRRGPGARAQQVAVPALAEHPASARPAEAAATRGAPPPPAGDPVEVHPAPVERPGGEVDVGVGDPRASRSPPPRSQRRARSGEAAARSSASSPERGHPAAAQQERAPPAGGRRGGGSRSRRGAASCGRPGVRRPCAAGGGCGGRERRRRQDRTARAGLAMPAPARPPASSCGSAPEGPSSARFPVVCRSSVTGPARRCTRVRGRPPRHCRQLHGYQYVDTPEGLAAHAAARSQARPLLGVDTEAAGYHRYLDRLSLVQVSSRRGELPDRPARARGPLAPRRRCSTTRRSEKIFHDADFDLRILDRDAGLTCRASSTRRSPPPSWASARWGSAPSWRSSWASSSPRRTSGPTGRSGRSRRG